jgi:cytoskeletal protein RodZ
MSLGSDLSAAREQAGLSLADVSERTRIRQTVIARIEADDFSLCGGDVYARGHVRTLAKVAGIDPEPLVAEYDRLHAPAPPTAAEVFEAEAAAERERRGPNWTAAMAAAVIVLLAIAGFQLLRSNGSTPTAGPPATGPSGVTESGGSSSPPPSNPPATTAPPASTEPSTTPSASQSVIAQVPPSALGVTVRLTVSGSKSWVSATGNGGKKLYEGLLSAGAARTFTDDKQVKLVIGNAGAVGLVVNGVDLGEPGGSGQVVRLTFGPGDPTGSG